MTRLEREIDKAERLGLKVIDGYRFESGINGMIIGRFIFLSKDLSSEDEKVRVLLEEVSHYRVNCGNILNQKIPNNRYQERKAHRRMVEENLPIESIVKAVLRVGPDARLCDVAEDLGVSEGFLKEAISLHRARLGPVAEVCGRTVVFDPFRIGRQD